MYQLEKFATGRFDVRAENGMRVGSIIGGGEKWCAEIGNRVLGYHSSTDEAARAILADQGIVGIYEQMAEIIHSKKMLHDSYFDDFKLHDRRCIEEYGCATNHLWVIRPTGTHLVQLDLPFSQREGEAVLNAVHPDLTGQPWDLYLIDAIKLKVLPISEAQARQLVAQSPKYRVEGTKITFHRTPIATISLTPLHSLASVGRRCQVRIDCETEPSTQQLALLKRLAFFAGTPIGNGNEYGAAATIEIRFDGKLLYHWNATT